MNACEKCVRQDQCDEQCNTPPKQCPGANEELVPCFKPKNARTCKNARPSRQPSCKPDSFPWSSEWSEPTAWRKSSDHCIKNVCDCKENFYRNECGICVSKWDCDKPWRKRHCDMCSDPNEIRYKRWRECEARTCWNLKDKTECHRDVDIDIITATASPITTAAIVANAFQRENAKNSVDANAIIHVTRIRCSHAPIRVFWKLAEGRWGRQEGAWPIATTLAIVKAIHGWTRLVFVLRSESAR